MSKTIAFAALIILPVGLTVAETASTTKNKPATTAKKRKTSTKKRSGTSTASTKSGGAASRPTWRTRQLQPTPDRYKEIQGALVSKGYLRGEPTGTWNQETVDAMRRFQQDQNLEATGKIDSLSLIALGLGPKHETAAASPPPRTTPPATN